MISIRKLSPESRFKNYIQLLKKNKQNDELFTTQYSKDACK